MGFKNWSSWVKGGVVGGIIGAILWIISFVLESNPVPFRNVFMFLGSPLCYIELNGEGIGWCWILYGHISNIILFFIIGSLIGFIIGKLKSKKQPQNLNQNKIIKK